MRVHVVATTLALAATALLLGPASRSAAMTCADIPSSERQALAAADVAFEGVALPGPSVDGVLLSPASFRVTKNLKHANRSMFKVRTATKAAGDDAFVGTPGFPDPSVGEKWRIYAKTEGSPRRTKHGPSAPIHKPLETSDCDRSRRIARAEPQDTSGGSFLRNVVRAILRLVRVVGQA